jgi:hypothetical protein
MADYHIVDNGEMLACDFVDCLMRIRLQEIIQELTGYIEDKVAKPGDKKVIKAAEVILGYIT